MLQQVVGAAVDSVGSYHVVTGISEVRDGVGHGSGAGSNGEASYSSFESGHTVFEDTLCSVGQTAVDVAGILEVEAVGSVLSVVEHIRGRLVDGYRTGIGCGVCLFLAYMKLEGLEMKFFLVAHNLFPFFLICFLFSVAKLRCFYQLGNPTSWAFAYHKCGICC